MPTERRAESRKSTFFKAAYIEHDGVLQFVTLKNVSESGVCFAGVSTLKTGDRLTFCFGSDEPREGVVAWTKGSLFGVKVSEGELNDLNRLNTHPARAVRLPIEGEATLYIDGTKGDCLVHNLSLKGACISTATPLRPGQLLSLEVAGQSFELATVKWVREDKIGVRFASPISTVAFQSLLSRVQAGRRKVDAICRPEPVAECAPSLQSATQ